MGGLLFEIRTLETGFNVAERYAACLPLCNEVLGRNVLITSELVWLALDAFRLCLVCKPLALGMFIENDQGELVRKAEL
jgi:hypothetical protein